MKQGNELTRKNNIKKCFLNVGKKPTQLNKAKNEKEKESKEKESSFFL